MESQQSQILNTTSDIIPFSTNIEDDTLNNNEYRKILFTGEHSQLVIMSIPVGKDIEMEIHNGSDQFIRVEGGEGTAKLIKLDGTEEYKPLIDGFSINIPSKTYHQIINTGDTSLKLYTVYSPPVHMINKYGEIVEIPEIRDPGFRRNSENTTKSDIQSESNTDLFSLLPTELLQNIVYHLPTDKRILFYDDYHLDIRLLKFPYLLDYLKWYNIKYPGENITLQEMYDKFNGFLYSRPSILQEIELTDHVDDIIVKSEKVIDDIYIPSTYNTYSLVLDMLFDIKKYPVTLTDEILKIIPSNFDGTSDPFLIKVLLSGPNYVIPLFKFGDNNISKLLELVFQYDDISIYKEIMKKSRINIHSPYMLVVLSHAKQNTNLINYLVTEKNYSRKTIDQYISQGI